MARSKTDATTLATDARPPRSGIRGRLLASVLLACGFLLAARLVHLQLLCGPALERLAVRQRTFRETVAARPGDILDRNGRLFATSVAVRSVYVAPRRLTHLPEVVEGIAAALHIDPETLAERIAAQPDQHFLWAKRRIDDAEAETLRSLSLPAGCWGFREEYRRHYPQGMLAAQVIGLRDIDGRGQGGIEQSCDAELKGRDGYRELLRDARGRVIDLLDESAHPPRQGATVVLTLDAVIQAHAERALDTLIDQWKPLAASAVVLDPQSGDVLAMASRPTFNPNTVEQVPAAAWKNRVIADSYEPGSTFKPFVVAWALQQGVIEREQVFDCENGEYRMGRRRLHDHHPYGRLDVVDILVKSSNIGMAKIGELLTNAELREATLTFGFGARTGIELPGELPGLVRPLREWTAYSTGSVPMGQEISATPLQVISAYSALCHAGTLVTPHVLLSRTEENGSGHAVVVTSAIDREIADWVRTAALTAVVQRGTGRKADVAGFDVFGKSGTAQKRDPETGVYSTSRHVSSFLCGAPAHAPRVLVLVTVDEASVGAEHFGGSVAAPAAGEILQKSLNQLRVPSTERMAARP